MPILYEVVELANGDVALQREGDDKGQPLVTMRFSTELLRFLRNGKLDIAKVMIEAGLEEVAKLAEDFTAREQEVQAEQEKKALRSIDTQAIKAKVSQAAKSRESALTAKKSKQNKDDDISEAEAVSHLIH